MLVDYILLIYYLELGRRITTSTASFVHNRKLFKTALEILSNFLSIINNLGLTNGYGQFCIYCERHARYSRCQ